MTMTTTPRTMAVPIDQQDGDQRREDERGEDQRGEYQRGAEEAIPAFGLPPGGELGRLIRAREMAGDWGRHPLGAIATWPQSLKCALGIVLASPVPMTLMWGEAGWLLYNDGYAAIGGPRHPAMLGQSVLVAWPEAADFNGRVLRSGLAGSSQSFRDQHFVLRRAGADEDSWFNLDYSPVLDESGRPAGVLAIVTETTERLRTAAALERVERRWTGLFDQMQEGFFIAEAIRNGSGRLLDIRFLDVNPAFQTLTGALDAVGRTLHEVFPGTDTDMVLAQYAEVLAGTQSRQFELFDPSAGNRWFEMRARALGEDRFAALFIDITADKQVASDLLKSEGEFRTLAEAVPNHAWAADAEGRHNWFNRRTYDYAGVEPGALDGDGWLSIIHPEDAVVAAAAWQQAQLTKSLYQVEFRLRRADGAYRWFLARALPVLAKEGRVLRWIGTNTDVDDQKTAQAALSQLNATLEERVAKAMTARRLWADIFEMTGAPIAAIDPNFCFMALNSAHVEKFERLYGVRPKVGDNILDLLQHRPADRAILRERWSRALAGEHFTLIHQQDAAVEGSPAYQLTYNAVRDRSGALTGAFQYALDVTDQLRDQARLAEAEAQLRQAQKMEAVGQLTGGVAHDFNNILQGITGAMEMVRRRIASGKLEGIDRFLDGALQSAQRAAGITQRLLAFSRRQSLDPKPIDVNAHMTDMRELLGRTLGPNIELQTRLAPDLWPAECDANQLESAVLNLALNARDAMEAGGELIIETRNVTLDDDDARKEADLVPGDYVAIYVTDSGVGMPQDVMERAFDPFFTTKPIGQGTGLGLSMIYGFAKQSHGHVALMSAPGAGTTVQLYLPRSTAAPGKAAPWARVPPVSLPGAPDATGRKDETVLVVEDEPAIRLLIGDLLQELGYRAIIVEDGQQAIPILRSDARIDLLISDVGLPGMNGREVAEIGRAGRPDLPVLFMTGYAEHAATRGGFLAPGMDMIAKPFPLEAMMAKIRAGMARS
ncbi:MAG: PAS domain-containing protein [Rhodospirillaceae bacterium]|nr:PAS domain-containing protein [Rhodospirillaceae bacterium]